MDKDATTNALKLIIMCLLWYASSSGGNIIGKVVLNEFPFPMTLTMIQLVSGAVYLGPILSVMGIPDNVEVPRKFMLYLIIPLSLGKFLSSVSAHISLWRVSVSYAHTVKATLPFFTVLLARIFLREKQTTPVYLSLIPIIGGVFIATLTELSFDFIGFASALTATLGFSIQTIASKKCLKETGLHHLRLLLMMCRIAAICFLPMWIVFDLRKIMYSDFWLEKTTSHRKGVNRTLQLTYFLIKPTVKEKLFSFFESRDVLKPILLLVFDGLFSMLQSVFAFSVLAMVAPLSYAVANSTKRIVIISSSLFLLRNPVTYMNVLGMSIAVFGVLCYNKAKYEQNRARLREQTLPLIQSESDLQSLVTKATNKVESIHHSKSTSDFKNNGFLPLENHILFQNNMHINNSVTLFPVGSDLNDSSNVVGEWEGDMDRSNLHSRLHHI